MPDIALFLAASAALTIAPGPDNLQVLARGISQGRAAGVAAAMGFATGCLFHTALAVLGIAAALRASPFAFDAIRIAGGLYLIWIGIQALRARGAFSLAKEGGQDRKWIIFKQSVLGNVMNPKVTLFFLVFLPQFVDARGNAEIQMAMLGLLFMAQTIVIFGGIGLAAGGIGQWLATRPATALWLNRLAGAVFVLIGVRAALPFG
ncbi:MAG: LysE family translocator [Burkholderiales bacterium]